MRITYIVIVSDYSQDNFFRKIKKCQSITLTKNKNLWNTSILFPKKVSKKTDVEVLRVYLDWKLLFDVHIKHISREANEGLDFSFCTCHEFTNINLIWTLYTTYENSLLYSSVTAKKKCFSCICKLIVKNDQSGI